MKRAPGRIEFIGNHTDYNGGWVIAAAIDAYITAKAAARDDNRISLASRALDSVVEVPSDILDAAPKDIQARLDGDLRWTRYPIGVAYFMRQAGADIRGFDIVFDNTLPPNSGLSSSAALEVSTLMELKTLFPFDMTLEQAALLCQRAENDIADVPCGNMDQFASLNGGLTYLDCRTLAYESLQLPSEWMLAVLNTGVMHNNEAKEGYPARRKECFEAAAALGAKALRDADMGLLAFHKEDMGEANYRRARHVIGENSRVHEARAVLRWHGPLEERYRRLYHLMRASHESSRDDFQNSCRELDVMADICWSRGLAARLSGGGFGGAVAVVLPAARQQELSRIVKDFNAATGGNATSAVYRVAQGAYR